MILLIIILLSLCAIYFTRFLFKRKMVVGAISVAVLYIQLIIWIYALFILDFADLGFDNNQASVSLLQGSNIYQSFVSITAQMSVLSLPILKIIVAIAAMTATSALIVISHGLFEITKAVVRIVKVDKAKHRTYRASDLLPNLKPFEVGKQIIRLNCRMNC